MFNNKMIVIQKQNNQLNFSFQEILQRKELLISTWNAIVNSRLSEGIVNSRLSEAIEPTFEQCKYVLPINIWYHRVSPFSEHDKSWGMSFMITSKSYSKFFFSNFSS